MILEGRGEPLALGFVPCVLTRFSHTGLFVTPWTAARQASVSMGVLQARVLGWVAEGSVEAALKS